MALDKLKPKTSSELYLGSETVQKKVTKVIEREVKVYNTLKSDLVKSMFVFTSKELTVELYAEYFI